jgi:hypothetical protein
MIFSKSTIAYIIIAAFFISMPTSCKQTTLPISPPNLVQAIDNFISVQTNVATTNVTVQYLDMSGNVQVGIIQAPEHSATQVIALFSALLESQFPISIIKPLREFSDLQDALTNNATFAILQQDPVDNLPNIFIFINPIANPILIKHYAEQNNISNNITIWPTAGLYAVNHNRVGQSAGTINNAINFIITQQGFARILGDNNILFYGLIALTPHTNNISAQPTHKKITFDKYSMQADDFSYQPLPNEVQQKLIDTQAWQKGCPVPLNRLSYVQITYYDYDGKIQIGHLVVIDVVAHSIVTLFKTLLANKIPFEKLMPYYTGSISGGTIAFNCRAVTGGKSWSLHSYGTAIDINYFRNPYIGQYTFDARNQYATAVLIPDYANLQTLYRETNSAYAIDSIVELIKKSGFVNWGGDWYDRTDYMHFSTPKFIARMLAIMNLPQGTRLFNLSIRVPHLTAKFTMFGLWKKLYKLYPDRLMGAIEHNIKHLHTSSEREFFDIIYHRLQKYKAAT